MSHLTRVTAIALLLCLSMVGAQAQAPAVRNGVPAVSPDARLREVDRDPKLYEQYFRTGKRVAAFCANCHGEGGMSKYAEVPNLAGQHPIYVLGQIDAFLAGKRKDAFMQGLMKVLSAEEKAQVSVFYAAQAVTPAGTPSTARAAEGRDHFERHCVRCHGADARGGENFPRLAGQQPEYLRRSLQRYLKVSGERIYPPMTAAVSGLGEKNIEAVVEYLANLR